MGLGRDDDLADAAEQAGIEAQDGFSVIDGHRLAWRWLRPEAPGGAAPVVFLHEGLGSIGMWGDFPDRFALATGRPVFLYERYGHGGSDPVAEPRPVDWMEHEAWVVLPALLAEQKIEAPILFGHSDGGSIALLYAARHPVPAVVTEAAHIYVDAMTVAGLAKVKAQKDKGVMTAFLSKFHGAGAQALLDAWIEHWTGGNERGWRMDQHLPGVIAPVLALQGSKDDYGTPEQITDIAAGVSGPAKHVLLDGIGHIPHQQVPDAVFDLVLPLLAGIEKGANR
jgi:pimeloyl-ACP methyl ester carboxylesterase